MQKKPGDGGTICAGFVPETADSADSMRDPQGKEGVHGPVPTKTQSLFSSQNTSRQAGSAASDKNL